MNTIQQTTEQIRQLVDDIMLPDSKGEKVKSLTSLLTLVSGDDSLAEIASAHAYTHTQDFADRYRDFIGWTPTPAADTPQISHETVG